MTSQLFKKLLIAIFPCLIVAGVLFFFFHPRTIEIKSEKNGWQILEEPEFQLEGIKEGAKIKVSLIDPKGRVLSLEEGKDFEIRSSSPTKIKILRNEDKLKPGLYKIKIEIEKEGKTETLEKAFPWGVLAINTNKSIYTASKEQGSEVAYIQMAVLGDDGHTICNANLKLKIKNEKLKIEDELSTADGRIQRSQECGPDNVTDKPDYFAFYQVREPGIYKITLTNLDNGYEIEDSFEVRDYVSFDVERIGPTRIWPKAPYEMTLKIKANQDFKGKIVETVPKDFSIVECQNCSLLEKPVQDFKELAFNFEMKKGEIYELKYKFDAPDVSPYLYLLGPLSFIENGSREAVFQEARHWQVAADAPDTLILRPNATGTYQQWSTFGDTVHWILTSDQNDNTGVQVTGTTTLKETENLADTTQAGRINSVTAYMRAKASSSTETYTLYAHQETITIAGTTYYLLKTNSADAAGTTFPQSAASTGRKNFGKWVYPLTDVISIPAATWTVYYRAYIESQAAGHGDVDILIRKSDGTIRTTIATNVANSANWGTSWATYSGTYSFPGYTVVDQTDYLEIDFYVEVTTAKGGRSAYLRIDDNTLALTDQTRVEGVSLDYSEKAVIVWRTHSTDYESSATTVSRTAFTDYSETRTVNPYTGSAWTWDEINNLEIGARATRLGSSDTIQVSEFWIVVDYTPFITVSGYAYENDGTTPWSGCDGTSKNIALAVNGTLTATTSCSTSTGAFSFSIAPPATSTPMVIYFKGVSGNYGSNVNRYSGSGDVTGILVRKNAVIVQHDDSGPITNADLNSWDNDNDPDVNYVVTNGNLTVESGSKLIINSNDTFTPGGTVTVNGDLIVMSGATLNGTSSVTVKGGNATGDGTINLTNGTFTLDGAGYFGGNSNWTFYNLTFGGDSNVETTTAIGTGSIIVSNILTIGANQTLDASSKTWTLSGSGTPFVINGTFTASSSTFKYTGSAATNITATTYYNLELLPSANGITFTLGTGTGQTIAINGYFKIGNGTNTGTITADTNDPILDINGDFTISSNATFIASNSSSAYFAKNWTNNGTFVHSTGTIVFDGSTTSTLSGATTFYNLTCTTPNKVLQFPAGTSSTTTIEGTLTLNGGDCSSQIKLRSSTDGSQWYINALATSSINYVDVKDSYAITPLTAYQSSDSGNNTNWTIYPCVAVGAIRIKGGTKLEGGVRLK
jgi:hypothetical protein